MNEWTFYNIFMGVENFQGWSINRDKEAAIPAGARLDLLIEANGNRFDIPTLETFLQITLPAEGKATLKQMRDVVESIGRPDRLVKFTGFLLANPDTLASLDAYGHSLGMDRIQFAKYNSYTVRSHFFDDENVFDPECPEDVHEHEYDFGSNVVSGGVITDLFIPDDEGTLVEQFKEGEVVPNLYAIGALLYGERPLNAATPTITHYAREIAAHIAENI